MAEEKIIPHKVTKPIQLLAAWLVGLCVIDGAFLLASTTMTIEWLQASLVIASVANVPIFIFAIFLLQTKFRPEMQEDVYYAKYLDKKTNQYVKFSVRDQENMRLERIETEVRSLNNILAMSDSNKNESGEDQKLSREKSFKYGIAINDYLPWFSDLRNELRKESFPVEDIFGAVDGTKPPEKYIVSIGNHLSVKATMELLSVLIKYPFDGISLFDVELEPEAQDVFIGAYGYAEGYAPFSDELKKMLQEGMEKVDLEHFIRLNKIEETKDKPKEDT